ncbi:hypothetical protein Plhal304r1_c009g0037421 [Plasmopara halstedii]
MSTCMSSKTKIEIRLRSVAVLVMIIILVSSATSQDDFQSEARAFDSVKRLISQFKRDKDLYAVLRDRSKDLQTELSVVSTMSANIIHSNPFSKKENLVKYLFKIGPKEATAALERIGRQLSRKQVDELINQYDAAIKMMNLDHSWESAFKFITGKSARAANPLFKFKSDSYYKLMLEWRTKLEGGQFNIRTILLKMPTKENHH